MTSHLKFIFCLACLVLAGYASAQKQGQDLIDSLRTGLDKTPDDTGKVKVLNRISAIYSTINTDEGLKFGVKALTLSQELHWKKGVAQSLNCIGLCYMTRGNNKLAVKHIKKAQKIYQKIGYTLGEANTYRNLAICYHNSNHFSKALEGYFTALQLYNKLCFKEGISGQFNNIANIYVDVENYENALAYFKRSVDLSRAAGNKRDLAIGLNNCSFVNRKQRVYGAAREYAKEALLYSQEIRDNYCISLSYKNLGAVQLEERELVNAMESFRSSLVSARLVNSEHRKEVALGYIGLCYLEMAKDSMKKLHEIKAKAGIMTDNSKSIGLPSTMRDSAIAYLESALRIGDAIHEKYYTMDYHTALSEIYELNGDLDKAGKEREKVGKMRNNYISKKEKDEINAMNEKVKVQFEVCK